MHISREMLADARRKFIESSRYFLRAPWRSEELVDSIASHLFHQAILLAGDCETNEEMDLAANVLRSVSQYTRTIMERERAIETTSRCDAPSGHEQRE